MIPTPDRRKGERRREVSEEISRLFLDRRGPDRRQKARRQYERLIYPLVAAPQVLNMRSQVVGLSAKAVRFFFLDFDPQAAKLKEGSKVKMTFKFHDGEIIEKTGVILRKDKYEEDKDHYVCLFDKELPSERIEKEKMFLKQKFPEISSEGQWDSPPILFFE